MKRALIIAAHPDDEVLGCGGLISKYQPEGVDFKVVFIGEGSSCRYNSPDDQSAKIAIRHRTDCAVVALAKLGVKKYDFHDLPCGRFDQVPVLSLNKIIEAATREFEPDTVFTHSPYDANNDHKIVFNATVMATRPVAGNPAHRLLCFEIPSSSEWAFATTFSPNYFEEISEHNLDQKCQALSLYESEIRAYPFPRSHEGLRAVAMTRGMQAGVAFAEAFHLVREFRK